MSHLSERPTDAAGREQFPVNPLRWFPEFLKFRQRQVRSQVRILGSSLLVGVIAGLGGIVFYLATQMASDFVMGGIVGYEAVPHPAGEPRLPYAPPLAASFHPWLLLVVPTIGGLLCGYIVYTYAPEAEGHGTDSVIAAYHQRQGLIRPRVPIVKIIASTFTLGTGGSGGREGPIAQIGAGFGSYLATLLKMSPSERRVLAAAGMGAGIAAVFRAPLAGALFAAEVLYWSPEFEAEVILPAALASVVSYCTFGSAFGWEPLFAIPGDIRFGGPIELVPYTLLALSMVVLAMLYTRTFTATTQVFRQLPVRRTLRPAIGALATGAIGLALYYVFDHNQQTLAVLSFGYNAIQEGLRERSTSGVGVLLAIALGKIVTNSLTIGSGGSGGVFGPSMVIGGCGGGAVGVLLHNLWPAAVPNPASFVIVGMAGFFAAAAKTPFSTLIIVSEMTGGYQLVLPALWVCVLSFMLSDQQSIYSSQVESRSRSPAHRGYFVRDALAGLAVERYLSDGDPARWLKAGDSLATIVERFDQGELSTLPVVDADNRFVGLIDIDEVFLAGQSSHAGAAMIAQDLMRTDVAPLARSDRLDEAMERFAESDLLALPVIESRFQPIVVGIAKRSAIAAAYLRRVAGSAD